MSRIKVGALAVLAVGAAAFGATQLTDTGKQATSSTPTGLTKEQTRAKSVEGAKTLDKPGENIVIPPAAKCKRLDSTNATCDVQLRKGRRTRCYMIAVQRLDGTVKIVGRLRLRCNG